MTAIANRPAVCPDCEEKPARRQLDDRWVCEGCYTEAALEADRAKRGPAPPPVRRAPDEKMWHVQPWLGLWRCVQTNSRGTQLLECGRKHHTPEDARNHASGLNERQADHQTLTNYCARHRSNRHTLRARFGPDAGRLECPICETLRTLAGILDGMPSAGDPHWARLNEWEQGFVVSVRSQLGEGVVLTEKQAATIEKLYRQAWDVEDV